MCITPTSEDHAQKDACRTAVDPSNRLPFGRRRLRKFLYFALAVNVPLPPFVSFGSVDSVIEALPNATRKAHERAIRELAAAGLPIAASLRTISTVFGISAELVGSMSRAPHRYYRVFKIKKGKKTRTIHAPKIALKLIQGWIGYYLARAVCLPECVFGFVPGKSGVIEAANTHCNARWVYCIDLRDFFPSVTIQKVIDALQVIGYSAQAADIISRLCTLNGQLTQGSPASPVLSNLVFLRTDKALISIAETLRIRYSRYADDLVFSGENDAPGELPELVRAVLTEQEWKIAEEKEKFTKFPTRLKVHGLLVHGTAPRLTKGYRNRIRAYRHLLKSNKIDPNDLATVRGHITYADFVERNEAGLQSKS